MNRLLFIIWFLVLLRDSPGLGVVKFLQKYFLVRYLCVCLCLWLAKAFIAKFLFVYMQINGSSRLNPLNLVLVSRDVESSYLGHSCKLIIKFAKNVSWLWLYLCQGWSSLIMKFIRKFLLFNISSCYGSIPWTLLWIERDVSLST